jgi:hypothetical protein
MMLHMAGSPVVAVHPKVVQWQYWKLERYLGWPQFVVGIFMPPMFSACLIHKHYFAWVIHSVPRNASLFLCFITDFSGDVEGTFPQKLCADLGSRHVEVHVSVHVFELLEGAVDITFLIEFKGTFLAQLLISFEKVCPVRQTKGAQLC